MIDAPGEADEATRSALLVADLAVLPSGPSAFDLRALARTVRIVRQAQQVRRGPPSAVVVLNGLRAGTLLAREALDLVRELEVPVATATIAERVGLADAIGQGVFAWDHVPARDAAHELRSWISELHLETSSADEVAAQA